LPKLEAKKDVKKGGVQSGKFSFLKGISVIVCEQFYPCSHLGLANQEEHLRHGCVSAMKIPPFPPWKIETDLHRDHPNVDFGRRAPLVELVPSKTSKIIVFSQPKKYSSQSKTWQLSTLDLHMCPTSVSNSPGTWVDTCKDRKDFNDIRSTLKKSNGLGWLKEKGILQLASVATT